jgi:hypothetical protein
MAEGKCKGCSSHHKLSRTDTLKAYRLKTRKYLITKIAIPKEAVSLLTFANASPLQVAIKIKRRKISKVPK